MTFDATILSEIGRDALRTTYEVHEKLGARGTEKVKRNQFGDSTLTADWECEEAVIRTLEENRVPITIISEEHGRVELGNKFLGILDGLDGTNRYVAFMKGDKKARYGTMFAIFDGVNPNYDNYLFSGVMEHPTRRLFFAVKDRGSFVMDIDDGTKKSIKISERKVFDGDTRVLIDSYKKAEHFDYVSRTFVDRLPKGYGFQCLLSSAMHYADLASGQADLVLECTRKGNLEIAVAYGLIKEAGGFMVALDGKELGKRKYFEFGQDSYVGVISAANHNLIKDFLKKTNYLS